MKVRLITVLMVLAAGSARAQQPSAAPADPSTDAVARVLSEIDSRIARAAGMLDQLEADLARRRKGVKDPKGTCISGFSMDGFMREATVGRYAKHGANLYGHFSRTMINHHLYKAAKSGKAAECAPLKAFQYEYDKKPSTMERACLEFAHRMLMARALVQKSPDFPGLCAQHLSYNAADVAAGASAICAVMAEQRDNPSAMCARLAPHFKGPLPRLNECRQTAGQYSGDGRTCPAIEDEVVREQCLATVAYHKASRAKNAELCQGSVLCRFMMGDSSALAAPERKMAETACSRVEEALVDEYGPAAIQRDFHDKGAGILSLLDDAKARLLSVEAAMAIPDIRVTQALDARLEKAARVKDRYQKSLKALFPPRR